MVEEVIVVTCAVCGLVLAPAVEWKCDGCGRTHCAEHLFCRTGRGNFCRACLEVPR